jgi:DNA repair exonuclease SbcCD ATPase subunit
MKTLLRAAREPLAVVVLLVAIVVGLTVHLLMLPLGLLVYLVAVVLASRDPAIAAAQRRASYAPITSRTFRPMVKEVDRAHRDIEQSVAQAQGPLVSVLQRITAQTSDLVGQAHELALKGQIIETFLAQINYHQLQKQIDDLDRAIGRTSDRYTLQQLQETRQALINRQSNARDLQTYIGRITAQLQNIDANLDNVLAETIRLRTADVVSADQTTNQVAERIRDLNADMSAFRRVLDTALVESGAAAGP